MKLANSAIDNEDFYAGRKLFKEAIKFSPRIIKEMVFWKTAIKMASGTNGVKLDQILKKHIN